MAGLVGEHGGALIHDLASYLDAFGSPNGPIDEAYTAAFPDWG